MKYVKSYKLFEEEQDPIGTKKNGFIKTGTDTWGYDPSIKEEPRVKPKQLPGFWHGSTDKEFLGTHGIHVGTKLAATQALQARIGVPAEGEWDGTREYGKTLLAGKKTLAKKEKELGYFCTTGFNCGKNVPEEDYYPVDRKDRALYSDQTEVSFTSKPIVFPVEIIGRMSNTNTSPHNDVRANSMMMRALKSGNAKSGFYYINDGEDSGSISAVVPNKSFLKII